MKLGIYGGTFDPPHAGHMNVIRQAVTNPYWGMDKVLVIPAATPPHKLLTRKTTSAQDRLEMTRIAVDELGLGDKVVVDDLELRREGKSYTADTLRELKKRYPDAELYFLMGTDMFMSFHTWHEPEVIAALAELVVFSREEKEDTTAQYRQEKRLEKDYFAKVTRRCTDVVEVSSTQLRKELGVCCPEGLSLPVCGYILRHGLYGTNADLKKLTIEGLRACSLSMVYAKRHKHILGVEETAVKLACIWGADPDLARRAGILHDCTKYLSLEEHLSICEAAGIELDELERQSEKLLHSKSGAATAKYVYGQPEEVYWAIFYHTTGRADMTLLEKIVYLADYMEPNRDFPGVEELRRLCYTDLDAALEMGLRMSVDDLTQRGVPIHKNTQGALDHILERRKG